MGNWRWVMESWLAANHPLPIAAAKSWQVITAIKLAFVLFAGLVFMPRFAVGATLKVGDRAPDFSLPDYNGKVVKLGDFRGKKSVTLAFYIRASTPG